MARDVKTHLIREGHRTRVITYCGKEGWGTDWQDEFDTATCDRFHAVPQQLDQRYVNCLSCRRIAGLKS